MLEVFGPLVPAWNSLFAWFTGRTSDQFELPAVYRDTGDHVVLFVHGLNGSSLSTWHHMLSVFESDSEVDGYALGCYTYPTSLLRLPFGERMAGIRQIASGLRTHIDTYYSEKKSIILVGHSLGGVIARQYIIEEKKGGRAPKVCGVVFFATPHTGAALANIGRHFSSSHRHLAQLCKGSDILQIINSDWAAMKIEGDIKALYIVGGTDAVVSEESAAPYVGTDNVHTIIGHGHTQIIEPSNNEDLRYKLLKRFVQNLIPLENSERNDVIRKGDVLFDVYILPNEPFYIERNFDKLLQQTTTSSNVWVFGPPGIGKTTSLKRLADKSEWGLVHIMLDPYKGLSAFELMREVANVLCERANIEKDGIPKNIENGDLFKYFRCACGILSEKKPLAILIEEIPLPAGEEYADFMDIAYHLFKSPDIDCGKNRIIWLFSSLRDPRPDIPINSPKFYERMQLLKLPHWDKSEALKLINMICIQLKLNFSPSDVNMIINQSKGSPRVVKMFFRRLRNSSSGRMTLQELLSSVETDLSHSIETEHILYD